MKHNPTANSQWVRAEAVVAWFACSSIEELAETICSTLSEYGLDWCIIASNADGRCRIHAHRGIEHHLPLLTEVRDSDALLAALPGESVPYSIGKRNGEEWIAILPQQHGQIEAIVELARAAFSSVEHQRQNMLLEQTLVERTQLLETMFELTRDVAVATSRERLLHIAGLRLLAHAMTTRVLIAAIDAEGRCTVWSRGFQLECQDLLELIGQVDTTSASNTSNLLLHKMAVGLGPAVLLPLRVREQTVGLILIGARYDGTLMDTSDAFLQAYANALAAALEQLVLLEKLVEQQRVEQELALARSIQQRLLPDARDLSAISSMEIAAFLEPARQVSGDYYDVVERGDSVLCIIADVCGKGMGAALIMAHLHAAFHILLRSGTSPAQVMTELNRLLYHHTETGSFVTAVVVEYNRQSRVLRYCNAGHPRPLLITDSNSSELEPGSLVLGVLEDVDYQETTVKLNPGTMLCLYSDGITEASRVGVGEFGTGRFRQILQTHIQYPLHQIIDAVRAELDAFTDEADHRDDRTLVLLRSEAR
jgi:sigma-B regulation protein RsbU (phosphoserine phosphatase)